MSLNYEDIYKSLIELSKTSNFRYFEFPKRQTSLFDFVDGTPLSSSLWGTHIALDHLPENEETAELRDGLAELIERLQEHNVLSKELSSFLWLVAAVEEDLAAHTPLVFRYASQWSKIKFEVSVLDILFNCSSSFLSRNHLTKDQVLNRMKKIKNRAGIEQNDFLKFFTNSDQDPQFDEENDAEITPNINETDLKTFKAYAYALEFPDLVLSFLYWYYNTKEVNYKEIIQTLEGLAKTLYNLGFPIIGLIPFEFSRLINKISERSIWNIDIGEKTDEIKEFLASRNIFELWPPQISALSEIINLDDSCFITQPTGSGKSLIAEIWLLLMSIEKPSKQMIYIVPTKALAFQVARDLGEIFKKYKLVVTNLSGMQLHPILDVARKDLSNILVMTPEKFNFMFQNGEFSQNMPSGIVLDEGHNIFGLNIRQIRTGLSILKARLSFHSIPILALSAVLENPEQVAEWRVMNFNLKPSKWRSTRLKKYIIDIENNLATPIEAKWYTKFYLPESLKTKRKIYDHVANLVIQSLRSKDVRNIIVFCTSRPTTEKIAEKIAEYLIGLKKKKNNKEIINKVRETIGEESKLNLLVEVGVAFHHAGLPPDLQNVILQAFLEGRINIIVSTTTLAEGLNTPVDLVLIPYTHFYSSTIKKSEKMSIGLINNMMGRAGRAKHGGIGTAYVYTKNLDRHKDVKQVSPLVNVKNIAKQVELDFNFNFDELVESGYVNEHLIQFRPLIYSLVCEKRLDSESPRKFIQSLDQKRRTELESQIIDTVNSFRELPNLIVEHSAMKVTDLGWIGYRTGLDPFSFNQTISYLENYKQELEELVSKPFLSLSDEEKKKILRLFFIPHEARLQKDNNYISVKHRLSLLDSWLNSNGSLITTKNLFHQKINQTIEQGEYDVFKITSTIFSEFHYSITWVSWSIFYLIKHHFELEVHPSYSLLPFYINSGTLSPFKAIMKAYNIPSRLISKFEEELPDEFKNDEEITSLFYWIMYDLVEIIETKFSSEKDSGLIALQLMSFRSPEEKSKAIFIASFKVGWQDLSMKALEKIDFQTRSYVEDLILKCVEIVAADYPSLDLSINAKKPLEETIKEITHPDIVIKFKKHTLNQLFILKKLINFSDHNYFKCLDFSLS